MCDTVFTMLLSGTQAKTGVVGVMGVATLCKSPRMRELKQVCNNQQTGGGIGRGISVAMLRPAYVIWCSQHFWTTGKGCGRWGHWGRHTL